MPQPHWQDCYQQAPNFGFQLLERLFWQVVADTKQGTSCTQVCKLEEAHHIVKSSNAIWKPSRAHLFKTLAAGIALLAKEQYRICTKYSQ